MRFDLCQESGPQRWRFVVRADAERVLLVRQRVDGLSTWVEMQPGADGRWTAEQTLEPDTYRFSYYVIEGETLLLGGADGLEATAIGPDALEADREAAWPRAATPRRSRAASA